MYAVIETGGRQVRVKEGGTVRVERLDGSPGDEVTLDRVLLVRQDASTEIGTPLLEGARVRARVVRQGRARKIRVMKYKAKARYRRRQGHRQAFTELRIEKIELDAKGGPGDKTEQPARPHERKARGGA